MKRNLITLCFLSTMLLGGLQAFGCPSCWRGYGPGAERFNKPLADLRIAYEKLGKYALPLIKDALASSSDPLVQQRAAGYIGELGDSSAVPLLEEILLELVKRVSFSTFGTGTPGFRTRLKAAHALQALEQTAIADRIWKKYEHLNWRRKSEVPCLLNALKDPLLHERLLEILRLEEDHQVLLVTLDILALAGNRESAEALSSIAKKWEQKGKTEKSEADNRISRLYLKIKADQTLAKIQQTTR